MEVSGKIIHILQQQSGQGKNGTWKKQDFVIETGDTYPKKICFSTWGDKIKLSDYSQGDSVTVSFDAESREYNGRWYTELKTWKLAKSASGTSNMPPPPPAGEFVADEDPNDLPF